MFIFQINALKKNYFLQRTLKKAASVFNIDNNSLLKFIERISGTGLYNPALKDTN